MRAARVLATLSVALLVPAAAGATSRASRQITVRLSPWEKAVVDDARDDRLDSFDPVTAAIALSPSPDDVKERARTRWQDFLVHAQTEALARPPKERAQYLLQAMHAELLGGGYAFYQNDVAVLLDEGGFNCVTSAIVYQAAAQRFGLKATGVLVPSHVYERVVIDGVDYDVETTSPRGFMLDRDDAAYQKFLTQMQLKLERAGVTNLDKEKFYRRETDAIDLLALLFENRGAEAVENGKTADAVGLFARAALLASDERYARDGRDLLLGQLAEERILKKEYAAARDLFAFALKDPGADPKVAKNFRENIGYCWVLEGEQKADKNDYEAALAAYAQAAKVDDDPAIRINEAATYNKWGLSEIDAKEYPRAIAVFMRARNDFPSDATFTQNLKAAYYGWSQSQLKAGRLDDAVKTMRELTTKVPGDPDGPRGIASVLLQVAAAKEDAGDWTAAAQSMEQALAACPDYPNLRANVAATWSNAGVHYAQSGDDAHAEAAWKHALEIDPGSTAARTNLERLRKSGGAGTGTPAAGSATAR